MSARKLAICREVIGVSSAFRLLIEPGSDHPLGN
jgi:hypothetical protein